MRDEHEARRRDVGGLALGEVAFQSEDVGAEARDLGALLRRWKRWKVRRKAPGMVFDFQFTGLLGRNFWVGDIIIVGRKNRFIENGRKEKMERRFKQFVHCPFERDVTAEVCR